MDAENGKIYFYNRITGKSEWKKPKGFDGVDIKERTDNEYTRTFKDFTATPLEEPKTIGATKIGKWEEVKPEDDFYIVNSVKNVEKREAEESLQSKFLNF